MIALHLSPEQKWQGGALSCTWHSADSAVWTPRAPPVGEATLLSGTACASLISSVQNHSSAEHMEQDAVTSCLQPECACPTHFIHLVPPHSALLWLQPARSRTTPVFLCPFGLSRQNGGTMYGETEHFVKKM